jgi:hypothetical protein
VKQPRSGDRCPCCARPLEEPFALYVVLDHDHETGKARDYICQSCNHLVGRLERGAIIRRTEVVPYLSRYLQRHAGHFDYAI